MLVNDWKLCGIREITDGAGKVIRCEVRDDVTVLTYWTKAKRDRFPYISCALKYVVPCPATNGGCEGSFSLSSTIIGDRGGQMSDTTIRSRTTLKFDHVRVCEATTKEAMNLMVEQVEKQQAVIDVSGDDDGASAKSG